MTLTLMLYSAMLATPGSLAITLTAPHAAATIRNYWVENSAIRFAASGLIGNVIFFGLDVSFLPVIKGIGTASEAYQRQCFLKASKAISSNAESISFFLAYLVDILVQHFLNALLVFGLDTIKTRELYLSSLATAYTAYFGTLCGSTILQAHLLRLGLQKSVSFWSTIALGSIVNYLVLTTLAARSKSQSKEYATENRSSDRSMRARAAMIGTPKYFAFLGQPRAKSQKSSK